MSELEIVTTTFASYKYSSGEWVSWTYSGADVYGEVRDRTKDSFTVDGNTISGDSGENVYKMEEYDTDSGSFTGQMVAKPESGLSSWAGPQEASDIEGAATSMTFESDDQSELDSVYSKWEDAVNMSASELERWGDHPCSDIASNDPQAVRDRNLRLLEKNKSDWTQKDIDDAKRTVSFVSRMRGQRPDSPAEGGKGSCPSEWAVSLLNWAYNPFDRMPSGEPNPGKENSLDFADGQELAFAASTVAPKRQEIVSEFNQYGIRKNTNDEGDLVSVDAVYEAMEPGPPEDRNGARITSEFLKKLAEKDYSNNPPYMMDHTKKTLSQIGFVKDVWFNENTETLMVMARAYNTGSQTHDEVINRLTFEPPTVTDGSVGLDDSYEYEKNDDGEIELTDARIREFSTTPFPGGYDEGGLVSYEEDASEAPVRVIRS